MASVLDVADFIVLSAGKESDMTQLKLQKMLYFAQGTHLARTGKPLFDDPILAWKLGPVVRSVYQKFNICGNYPIAADVIDPYVGEVFTKEEADTIVDVILEYGKYSASYLVDITHAPNSPWCASNITAAISNDLIRSHFIGRDAAPVIKIDCSAIPMIGRNEGNVLILPADDEDWSGCDEV